MKRFSKFVNTVLKFIQNRDVKGKYWFFLKARERLKGRLIKHDYGRSQFFVPYEQWCFWKTLGPHNYYLDEINPFIDTLNKELENFYLFDLGADVGVISLITSLNCPKLKTIHAFQPNPNSYRIMALNADSNYISL